MKEVKILTRNEAKEMSEKDISKFALDIIQHKNYIAYIYECTNSAGVELNCNTYFNHKNIKYITYPDYVVNIHGDRSKYKDYVLKQLQEKTFNNDELTTIKNYKDFKNKIDFIYNILPQMLNGVSWYDANEEQRNTYFKSGTCYLFKTEEEAEQLKNIIENLYTKHFKKLTNNKSYLYSACVYEFYNHETPIDWNGMAPALNALGIIYNKTTAEQKTIINKAYKTVCNGCEW